MFVTGAAAIAILGRADLGVVGPIARFRSTVPSLTTDAINAELYEQMLPYEDRNAVGFPEIILGSVARPLGLLALQLGRPDDATDHFERAIAMNADMGARPWVAHARYDYGRALAETRGTVPAAAHLEQALAEYRALAMKPWERQSERALAQLRARAG